MGFLRNGHGGSQHSVAIFATILLAFSCDIDKVFSIQPEDTYQEHWPEFDKRNLGSLARDGYIRNGNILTGYKRSIATLAKNGQLPTFQSPSPAATAEARDSDEEKRNLASIARMRSLYALKRNVAALAKNGARGGKRSGYYNYMMEEKRNLGSLARNGYIRGVNDGYGKRQGNSLQDEYYFPFYQTPEIPASELGEDDYNELYDNSATPDVDVYPNDLLSLQQSFDKRNIGALLRQTAYDSRAGKRNVGLPNHGIFRGTTSGGGSRSKRNMLFFPGKPANGEGYYDTMAYGNEWGDDNADFDAYENHEKRYLASSQLNLNNEDDEIGLSKRHIGSLARLGWLPQFRSAGGRYNRAGRGRELFSSYRDPYRKYSGIEAHGLGKYLTGPYKDDPEVTHYDTNIPPSPILADQESPAGERGTSRRPISTSYYNYDDLQATHPQMHPQTYLQTHPQTRPQTRPHTNHPSYLEPQQSPSRKTRWTTTYSRNSDRPKFFAFRSMVFPSSKSARYEMLPSNSGYLRKTHPNISRLPNRSKN